MQQARSFAAAVPALIGKEIWQTRNLEQKGSKAVFFGLLRIITITVEGIMKNRIPSQAAALSYYTLIALGPLIAIVIMVSGFVVKDNQQEVATKALTDLVYFIAPSAEEAEKSALDDFFADIDANRSLAGSDTGEEAPNQVNPQLVQFIDDVVENARSGAVGVIGTIILIFISIQLLSTIEKTFNTIWGARNARNIAQRVVFYWTFISLGAVLSFTAITLGTVSAITSKFEDIPFIGEMARDGIIALAPLLSFALIILLLTIFNRFIPNTQVRWLPAALGAVIVAILLILNQQLSFLYIGFVIRQQSLFGAVGILPILLFGLFVFWVVLLLGGQLTYAIQNVNSLTNQRAWEHVSLRTRELLSLAAFLQIARRFQSKEKPYSVDELSAKMRVPGNILNETLARLCDMDLLIQVNSGDTRKQLAARYQPALPIESLTLAEFKECFEGYGNNDGGELLHDIDPLLPYFEKELLDFREQDSANKPISELFRLKQAMD